MKRVLAIILLLALPGLACAEGEGLMYHFEANTGNLASVQRGARDFMNYCSGCHSLEYLRYERLSKDLGIPEKTVKKNLIFGDAKMLDPIVSAMPQAKADEWLGKAPPDLSQIARYKGAEWLYNYLMTYYLDPGRSTGVNNLTYPKTAMPDVLWELQGWQKPVYTKDAEGEKHVTDVKLESKGTQSPQQYARTVGDIVNFLTYAGEPMRNYRESLGFKVLIFLVFFTALAYLLKKEFWKDVH